MAIVERREGPRVAPLDEGDQVLVRIKRVMPFPSCIARADYASSRRSNYAAFLSNFVKEP